MKLKPRLYRLNLIFIMGKKISLLVAFGNFLLNDRASKESHPEKQDVVSDSDIQNFLNSQKEAKKIEEVKD